MRLVVQNDNKVNVLLYVVVQCPYLDSVVQSSGSHLSKS